MNLENTARSVTRKACISCGQEFSGDAAVCPHDGTTLTPLTQEDVVGTIIGDKYEVLETIGGGGMGMIYKAKHILMKRIVAIKMMHPQYVSSTSNLKRFQQEAQAASALSHPNILAVFDFGLTPAGAPFLVMDFLEGTNLAEVLDQNGYMPAERATNIFAQACSGLAHAHSKGVIHRDLKPGNIMLVEFDHRKDFVKIVDFGIAKVLPMEGESNHLTQTGEVFGSPLYMSPEQCRGRVLDTRSDIYSLGCVMYRTLTGSSPFFGQDPMECMYKQVNEVPNKFFDTNPDTKVPEALEAIVFKCLAKEPGERFQTMIELKEALLEFGLNTPGVVLDPEVLGSLQSSTNLMPLNRVIPASLETTAEITAAPESMTKAATGGGATAGGAPAGSAAATAANAANVSNATSAANASTKALNPTGTSTPAANTTTNANASNETTTAFNSTTTSGTDGVSNVAGVTTSAVITPTHQQPTWKRWAPMVGAFVVVTIGIVISFFIANSHPPQPQVQHIASFDSALDIAEGFYNKADYASAAAQINDTLKRTDLTEDRRAEALNMLGDIEREAFQLDAAISSYQQVLDIEAKAKKPRESYVAHALNGLGHIYTKRSELPKAEQALQRALKIDRDFSGDDHIEYARTSFELGNLALKQGKIAEARKHLIAAKQIIENAKGPNDPETASVCNALAQVYQYEGKYKEAETLYLKALQIRSTKLTAGNIETADTLLCLGTLNFVMHKYGAAESQLLQSLATYQKKFGDNNETVAENQFCLAVLYDQQKKYAQAAPYYKAAYQTQKTLLGATSAKTMRTQKYYANVLTKLQKRDEAQKVLSGQ